MPRWRARAHVAQTGQKRTTLWSKKVRRSIRVSWSGLVSEDLGEEFILHLIEVFERCLKDFAVVAGGGVQVVTQAASGVMISSSAFLRRLVSRARPR